MVVLDDISIFVTVVDSGSFVAAAKRLKMPPSTVSRRISQLETDLSIQLMERTSRKMYLTERGRIFYSQCSPHVQSINESITGVLTQKNSMKGKIKVTIPTFMGSELLSHTLIEFGLKYKSVDLEIVLSNSYEDIIRDDIDFAIRVGPLKDSKFISRHLVSSQTVLCTAPSHLSHLERIKLPQDLTLHPFILNSHQESTWTFKHKKTKIINKIKVTPKFRSNEIILNRKACLNGLGFCFLPEAAVKGNIESGELILVLPEYDILPERDIYIIYPSKKHLSKRASVLLEFLTQKVSF